MEPASQPPSRRDFLDVACAFSGCATCAFAAVPAVKYLLPQLPSRPRGLVDVGRREIPDGACVPVFVAAAEGGTKVVPPDTPGATKVLIVRLNRTLRAVEGTCTHLGCGLFWSEPERLIRCPCHGATFHFDGTKPTAPASRDLCPIGVREEEDGRFILTF